MLRVGGAIDLARLPLQVALEDVADLQGSAQRPSLVAQRELIALGEVRRLVGRHRQRDRQRPHSARRELGVLDHTGVIGAGHEPVEWRVGASGQQPEVGERDRIEPDAATTVASRTGVVEATLDQDATNRIDHSSGSLSGRAPSAVTGVPTTRLQIS